MVFCDFGRFRRFGYFGEKCDFGENWEMGISWFFHSSGKLVKNELFQEYLLEALIPGYQETRTVEKPGYLDIRVKTVSGRKLSGEISWNPGKTEE